MTPRIAPGGPREAGPFAWTFARAAGLVTRTAPPQLFLIMGRQHRLFRGWLRFAGRLMPGGTLPRRDTELVILRVAHLRGCAYEFEHHVRLGRRAGVDEQDVKRVQGDLAEWSGHERVLLGATDALVAERDLDDAQWTALRAELTEPQLIEFLLLVGHYDMLAMFLNTLRVQPDRYR